MYCGRATSCCLHSQSLLPVCDEQKTLEEDAIPYDLSSLFLGATVDWASISTPPRFIHEKNGPVLYFKVEKHGTEQSKTPDNLFQITINCLAEGNPPPT